MKKVSLGLVPLDRFREVLGEIQLLAIPECKDMVEQVKRDRLEDLGCREHVIGLVPFGRTLVVGNT